jgi:5-deoxy-D-glucuronate isomerase
MSLAQRHRLPGGPGVHAADDERMQHLAFSLVRTTAQTPARLRAEDRETLLVILENAGGSVTVDGQRFAPPDRVSVFDDPPSAVYAPPGAEIVVEGSVLAGAFTAAASDAPAAYLIERAPRERTRTLEVETRVRA